MRGGPTPPNRRLRASRLALLAVVAGTLALPAGAGGQAVYDARVTVRIPVDGGGEVSTTLPRSAVDQWRFTAKRSGGDRAYQTAPAPDPAPVHDGSPLTGQSAEFPPGASRLPGTISSIAGGRCEGYPAKAATISPTRVAMDRAGNVFWIDQTTAVPGFHTGSSVLIRRLDRAGLVRTIGSLYVPDEGRAFRQHGDNTVTDVGFLTTLLPDERGGVTVNRVRPDWSIFPDKNLDIPVANEIVNLRADGTEVVLAGGKPPIGQAAMEYGYGNGDRVTDTALPEIDGFTLDEHGNIYLAETDSRGFGSSRITFANRGSTPVVFYPGTPNQIKVPPGRIWHIAGDRLVSVRPVKEVLDIATTTRPVPAVQAILQTLPKLQVVDGMLYLLNTNWDSTNPFTFYARPSHVMAINLFSRTPKTVYGTAVPAGYLSAVAGNYLAQSGYSGDGGPATAAQFGFDYSQLTGDFTVVRGGPLFISDTRNERVRAVDQLGIVRTVAGIGVPGLAEEGAKGKLAPVWWPLGMTADPRTGEAVFADWGNARILRLTRDGRLRTVAGRGPFPCGDGQLATGAELGGGAYFGRITDVASASAGNRYVADGAFNTIRRIRPDGRIDLTIGRPSRCGPYWQTGYGYPRDALVPDGMTSCPEVGVQSPDGPLATVRFASPKHIAVDSYDNLVVSDVDRIRYVNLRARSVSVVGVTVPPLAVVSLHVFPSRNVDVTGVPFVTTGPGDCAAPTPLPVPKPGPAPGGVDCRPVTVQLTEPIGDIALDSDGSIYIADPFLHVVYRLGRCSEFGIVAGNGSGVSYPVRATGTPRRRQRSRRDRWRSTAPRTCCSSPTRRACGRPGSAG